MDRIILHTIINLHLLIFSSACENMKCTELPVKALRCESYMIHSSVMYLCYVIIKKKFHQS